MKTVSSESEVIAYQTGYFQNRADWVIVAEERFEYLAYSPLVI